MKKKIFNALLMGVLALTSVSTLVSCKDYDDDIDSLKLEQADLTSQLTSLQSSVDTQVSSINSQITTINESLSNLGDLKTTVDKAAAAAEEAGKVAAEAKTSAEGAATDAEAAQKAADEALTNAKNALAAAESANANATSALTQLTELSNKLGSLETLAEGIPALVEAVNNAATKEDLAKVSANVAKYQNYFDNLFAMVTSVELYGTVSGDGKFNVESVNGLTLDMMHGNVGETSVFGDNEAYRTSSPLVNYTKNADIKSTGSVILRVNPVNANLSANNANCKIMFINSKGEAMDDYVEVESVSKYNQLITRGSNINSGLWQVNVQLKDGVDMTAFKNAIENEGKTVLFAVAVNNTDTANADRYVASTYDLAMASTAYEPTKDLGFKVNGTPVKDLKNRWDGTQGLWDNNTTNFKANEYTWKDGTKDYPTPATAIDSKKNNVENDANDIRNTNPFLAVQVGQDITVSLNDLTLYPQNGQVEHYYVVLDKDFAQESSPSEWNAWTSYSYEGLGVTKKATEDLTLKINSQSAVGDKIGFRLFAVNYDGTLVDPDGKAFYVEVGNPSTTASVDVTITAGVNGNSAIVALPKAFASTTNVVSGTIAQAGFDKDGEKSLGDATIQYQLYKDAEGKEPATDWSEAKYIGVTLSPVGSFQDGKTFTTTVKATNGDIQTVNELTINVTKVMPTTPATNVTFKSNQEVNGVYTCYVDPETDWTTLGTKGVKDLAQAVSGPNGAAITGDYKWVIADALYNASKKVDEDLSVPATGTAYNLEVENKYIDNATKHATTLYYIYKGISLTQDKDGKLNAAAGDYDVAALTTNVVFACAVNENVQSYSWKKLSGKDVNYIVYEATTPAGGISNWETALQATNLYDNVKFGGNWTRSHFLADNDGVTAELISNDTKKPDYFNVTIGADGTFTFTPKSDTTNPTADVPSTLYIHAKDAFGHTNTYSVDFVVKQKK